jgi:hypothetical protein
MEIPDYSGGFGWGRTRLRLGHDGKEEDAADSQGPHVSDSRERGARAATTSWVGPCYRDGRVEKNGCSARRPKRKEGEQAGSVRLGRASRPPGRR